MGWLYSMHEKNKELYISVRSFCNSDTPTWKDNTVACQKSPFGLSSNPTVDIYGCFFFYFESTKDKVIHMRHIWMNIVSL
jgi:hypothetical protein